MSELNVDQARFNMIEQQIRPWEVLDQAVLDVLFKVPREEFVPPEHRRIAFADTQIPLGHGQVMMTPNVEGRMLQALRLRPGDRILEVGTGSGFITACLAELGAEVVSVDILADFTQSATAKLAARNVGNVRLETGDAATRWGAGQYDAIAITGALQSIPEDYQRQLTVGGRLFAIVGRSPVREALLITRVGEEDWATDSLFETDLPELSNAPRAQEFVF